MKVLVAFLLLMFSFSFAQAHVTAVKHKHPHETAMRSGPDDDGQPMGKARARDASDRSADASQAKSLLSSLNYGLELGAAYADEGQFGLAYGLFADYQHSDRVSYGLHYRHSDHQDNDFDYLGLQAWYDVYQALWGQWKVGGDLGVASYEQGKENFNLAYGLKAGYDFQGMDLPVDLGAQVGFITSDDIVNVSVLGTISHQF